jgi:hypothetical protein
VEETLEADSSVGRVARKYVINENQGAAPIPEVQNGFVVAASRSHCIAPWIRSTLTISFLLPLRPYLQRERTPLRREILGPTREGLQCFGNPGWLMSAPK